MQNEWGTGVVEDGAAVRAQEQHTLAVAVWLRAQLQGSLPPSSGLAQASDVEHAQVVPMENEGGRGVVEGGALCERKNARGVDPNRNWEVHWGFREKDYDPNEEYPGARPFRCSPFESARSEQLQCSFEVVSGVWTQPQVRRQV